MRPTWRVGHRAAALLVVATAGLGATAWDCASLQTSPTWRNHVARTPSSDEVLPHFVGSPEQPFVWRRRAIVPAAYHQACDLATTPSGLVIAASTNVLTDDGAALYRLPTATGSDTLTEVLHWSGQGFLRVHAYGDLLVVPDADAPFHLLPFVVSWDVDGYVFVSDPAGALTSTSRELVPSVYHVFDTARLAGPNAGPMIASTGAYPVEDTAYVSARAPAALFRDAGPGHPWQRILEYPRHDATGVTRFTYLLALPDGALLTGVESRGDLPSAARIDDVLTTPRVTAVQGLTGFVLRWARWRDTVYVVTQGRDGTVLSRSTDEGQHFIALDLTEPQSVAATDNGLFLLADGSLLGSADGVHFTPLAPPIPALRHQPSSLVTAPLVVHQGSLWAASPATGEVFEAVPVPTG